VGSFVQYLGLIIAQHLGSQKINRIPELNAVTTDSQCVAEYNQVMSTDMALLYALGVDLIQRAQSKPSGGMAIDLGCGPGLFTTQLQKGLCFESVLGMDLSPRMIETAANNIQNTPGESSIRFQVGDMTDLSAIETGRFDLVTATNAFQHLPDLATIQKVLQDMDRIAKPEGLIMVLDPGRLRTSAIIEDYVHFAGQDFIHDLPHHFEEFRNSIYGAWTAGELKSAIPVDTSRTWYHLVSFGLPATQIIIGLPIGREKLFLRRGFTQQTNPTLQTLLRAVEKKHGPKAVQRKLRLWRITQMGMAWGSKTKISSGN